MQQGPQDKTCTGQLEDSPEDMVYIDKPHHFPKDVPDSDSPEDHPRASTDTAPPQYRPRYSTTADPPQYPPRDTEKTDEAAEDTEPVFLDHCADFLTSLPMSKKMEFLLYIFTISLHIIILYQKLVGNWV